jgi:oxazoline/thiazoline synthase
MANISPSISLDNSTTLQWNAGLLPLTTPGDAMSLLLENRQFQVSDPLLQRLVILLQQPASLDSLVRQTCPPHDETVVREAIAELYAEKIIACARPQPISRNSAAFWDIVSCDGPSRPVAVESLLPKFGTSLEGLLKANGVAVEPDGDLTVLVTDDYLRREMTERCNRHGAILPAKPVGNEIWIGPVLSPQTGLCWECLAWWLRLRRWPELAVTGVAASEGVPSSSVAWLPGTMTLASGWIATAATLWAAGQLPEQLASHLWTFDLHTLKSQAHPIAARRNCPRCSASAAAESVHLFEALRSPRTGIMDRLRASDGPIGFVHLAHCAVLLPLPRPGVRDPAPPLSADGKAPTLEEAVRRCSMEAIERYCCVFTGDEPVVWARLSETAGLAPDKLLLFSDTQLAARDEWNARPGTMHGVPERFDPTAPTLSVKAQPLLDQRERYVPAGCAWLWYPFHDEPFYDYADTNGCAAGDTFEDATVRALLELIERDALSIWWYNQVERPGVDLAGWKDDDVQTVRQTFAAHRRSLALLDLKHDLDIPVYAAVSADDAGGNVFFGCAADVCGVSAAKRALAELTQFWYWSEHIGPGPDRHIWLEKSSIYRHRYLVPWGEAPVPTPCPLRGEEALARCVKALRGAELEAYVVDLTRPEIAIPVVRAVCPGLRHYGPRFAPGRLYDVPVKMGWRAKPLREEEMNPDACVL